MSKRIKVDDDIAALWRSGHQRRSADLGLWLRNYLRKRRLRAFEAEAAQPKKNLENNLKLIKKVTV